MSNLWRPYAKAKEDCNTVAKAACEGLCDYLKIDDYNPFCAPNFKDPVSGTNQSGKSVFINRRQCLHTDKESICDNSFEIRKVQLLMMIMRMMTVMIYIVTDPLWGKSKVNGPKRFIEADFIVCFNLSSFVQISHSVVRLPVRLNCSLHLCKLMSKM